MNAASHTQPTPYVPGRSYLVTEVRASWPDRQTRWWVVMGPQHHDAEILNFPHQHYHVDPRFIPPGIWLKVNDQAITTRGELPIPQYVALPITQVTPSPGDAIYKLPHVPSPTEDWIRQRRRRCFRAEAPYPSGPGSGVPWPDKLHRAFEQRTLPDSLICPHRGADLSTIAPDAEGCVTCPLHGLRWNIFTKRTQPPSEARMTNAE